MFWIWPLIILIGVVFLTGHATWKDLGAMVALLALLALLGGLFLAGLMAMIHPDLGSGLLAPSTERGLSTWLDVLMFSTLGLMLVNMLRLLTTPRGRALLAQRLGRRRAQRHGEGHERDGIF